MNMEINPSEYKVLIVDDVISNVLLLKVLLTNEKFKIVTAGNGTQALEQVKKENPDLVLLDVMMPGMDGYEAPRTIRLSEKVDAADIPIIALTANAFAEDAKAAHDAGMNAHLSKPLDFNKLKNILARIKKNGSVSL